MKCIHCAISHCSQSDKREGVDRKSGLEFFCIAKNKRKNHNNSLQFRGVCMSFISLKIFENIHKQGAFFMQIPILQKFKNSQNEKPGKGSRLVRSLMKIITTIFCVSAALVFIVNIIITKVNIEDEKQRLFEQTVQYYTAEVSGWMDVQIQQLKLMQHKLQSFAPQDLTYANIMPVVQNATEYGQERGVVSDYVVLNTKEIISGDGWQAEAGYDATKNEYYIKPQSMDVYVSEPYIDTVSHDFVITISVPIQIDGKFYGVLARDVSIAAVQEILHSYEETEGSYLYLLDAKGGILIHENEAYETTSSQLITVSDVGMTSMQEAIGKTTIEKDYDGENKYFFAEQEPDSGWIVGIAYPQKAVRHDIITQVLCSLVFFVAAVVIGLFILTSIMRKKFLPIYDVTNAAKQLEYGNFDIHLNVNSQDELGDLALSFEDTGDYLRSVIKEISNILQELTKGNLTVKTTLEYRGEFVTVQTAIHHIIRQMNEVMYNIEMAGEQVSSGAAQVADNAQHLSENSMTQAAHVESIFEDMRRVKEAVEENTRRTVTTETVTMDVSKQLEESKNRMSDMMQEMDKIKQSSSEIGKIIKTIEDIAFQTNILALNAAVEAARAGAAGKGFAVVADEVRALANKSAEAAQNTTALIQTSIETVDRGVEVAHQTEKALLEAVEFANQVVEETQAIAETSQEQSNNIDHITQTISDFSDAIQTNTATAEENAATSEEMAGQAQILQELLERFVLDHKM